MARPFFAAVLGFCAVGLGLAGCVSPGDRAADLNPLGIVAGAPGISLVGATPAGLTASFGAPRLRRVDGPAEVWLYHSSTCALNLILYPDAAGIKRVAAAVPDNGDAAACVSSLQQNLTSVAMERVHGS